MNIENQIPMAALQNVTNMLSFADEVLSDEDGRLAKEELEILREEMKEKLNSVCESLINQLQNMCEDDIACQNFTLDNNAFYDFGLNLLQKISTRYQNAHVRITFKTVTGYVCEEISESEVSNVANEIAKIIKSNVNELKNSHSIDNSYDNKVLEIVKEHIKILEDSFKSINIPSEHKKEEKLNEKPNDITDSDFVEKSVKYAEYLLDNEGKNSMLKYVRTLAEQLVKNNN